jgi:hypothetical protein
MLDYLETIYGNLFRQRDAEIAFNRIQISIIEIFSDYYFRFFKLV